MINGDYIMVVAPDGYPGYRYRGRYCYEHRLVYWLTHGVMPGPDEVVHHKNEDKHDNRPENLELLKSSEHSIAHGRSRGKGIVAKTCPQCGSTFSVKHCRRYKKFCSRQCAYWHTKPFLFQRGVMVTCSAVTGEIACSSHAAGATE